MTANDSCLVDMVEDVHDRTTCIYGTAVLYMKELDSNRPF